MTQNFIQPKGSLNTKVDTSNLQNQLAQMFANQQLQGQAQAQAQTTDSTRQTLQDYLNNKLMQEIEIPRFTTIQDIFNAPKGEKLKTFGSYLNTPTGQNALGGLLSLVSGGKYFTTPNDSYNQYLQSDMQKRQAQALQQLKEQNDIATALNQTYAQQDIANERNKLQRELAEQELDWKRQQNELDRALKQQELNATIAHQRAMEGIARDRLNNSGGGGSVTGGAANIGNTDLSKVKFTPADRKSLTENKTTLANIESGLKSLEENPNAYSFLKGVLGADITNRIDPKGVATRTQIDNITAVYRKWLTGAQMSDKERKAYERFLPAPTDNYNIVKSKLEGMKGAVQRSNDALLSNYGISTADEPAMLSIDNNALQAELKRRGLK